MSSLTLPQVAATLVTTLVTYRKFNAVDQSLLDSRMLTCVPLPVTWRLGQLRAASQNQRFLLALQSVAPGDDFKLAPDCILDGNYRVHLKNKRGQHRTKLVNRHRIVAFHQHVPAPLAD